VAIRSVTPTVLVKEQDPTAFVVNAGAGVDLSKVNDIKLGTGVTVTDIMATKAKVTFKAVGDASSLTGPTSFTLVNADGTEIESGDKVIRIFDVATADVRKELVGEIAALRAQLAAVRNEHASAGYATQAYVNDRLAGFASKQDLAGLATKQSVDQVIAAGVELSRRVATFEELANDASNNTTKLSANVASLAGAVSEIGGTGVKKGVFGGKQPLNAAIAQKAAHIRAALEAANAAALANSSKQ
jgi:hypothetical protein